MKALTWSSAPESALRFAGVASTTAMPSVPLIAATGSLRSSDWMPSDFSSLPFGVEASTTTAVPLRTAWYEAA